VSAYDDRVARGVLAADPAQRAAAQALDRVAADLLAPRPSGLARFFARPQPVTGLYLVGEVGRGKTMLMDMFFGHVPIAKKRRLHFHEFMDEMHQAIAAFRAGQKDKKGNADPVAAVVKPVIASTQLLCLDEFHVHDITNAMLLGRLFERLFEAGVVLVATSNVEPDGLYANGLNRELVLPFIGLLKQHTQIVRLDARKDYRQDKFSGQDVFYFGTGPTAQRAMDHVWSLFASGEAGMPAMLESLGRVITVPCQAMGAARFSFAQLCEKPLGARDYLRLANAYDALVIDGVPQFDRTRSDASKRFILLIDTLYDRGVKLAASFAVPLAQLGADDKTRFEFQRTLSRLAEMGSDAYLAAPKRPAPESTETIG